MKRTYKMPRGVDRAHGKMRISVKLDKDVFEDVCTYGRNRGLSFSDAINDLVICGIFDMKESGEFDKTTEK